MSARTSKSSAAPVVARTSVYRTREDFLAFFKRTYGPTIALYARIANDPTSSAELDEALTALARDNFGGRPFTQWEFLLGTATVA